MVRQAEAAAATGRGPARPLWFTAPAWALTLVGLGIAIYMTYTHFNQAMLVCSSNSKVDCHAVTSSKYGELLGIPLGVLGIAFFVAFAVLITPFALRSDSPLSRWGRLASVGVGVVFVIYLVTVELAILHKICLWCTGVHVITALLFVLVLADEFRRIGQENP